MDSVIRDIDLAPQGIQKIDWVEKHMPVLSGIAKQFREEQPFAGLKVVVSVHLEAKTAYLAQVIHEGGGEVYATGSNPLSTQDDVCAGLASRGVTVLATHGCTLEEYHDFQCRALSVKPDVIIDDGGDMVHILHEEHPEWAVNLRGGCEETTTGIIRLRNRAKAGQLRFPMFNINDADCKHLFDNRYGTGQSVWDGVMRTTNLVVAGTTVVVAGYGWCGKGVAMRAKGLGAKVVVTEVDPVKAIEAVMDGFTVLPMAEAAKVGDWFVTVTGCDGVMIARGALGDPWLFERVNAAIEGLPAPKAPNLQARMNALRRQVEEMVEQKGEFVAMPQARSQTMHYMKGLKGAANLRRYCCTLTHLEDLDELIDAVFEEQRKAGIDPDDVREVPFP